MAAVPTKVDVGLSVKKPKGKFLTSVEAELVSRKWRAMMVGLLGPVLGLIPHADKAIAWIAVAATWTFTIAAYILGIAIEDNGTKRSSGGDTNINVDAEKSGVVVRAKRTSQTPFGQTVTEETVTSGGGE